MRLDHSMRVQISERNLAMFTVSRLAKSSLLVLLTATLTTAAYAGGGHSGSNGSNGSHGFKGASQPVHASTVIVPKHNGKTSAKGSVALSKRQSYPHNDPPIVRDHRGSEDEIGNTVGGHCYPSCEGEGGLKGGAQPAQNQDHSTGAGTPQVTDHRTGH
jgi:hypothetical protein